MLLAGSPRPASAPPEKAPPPAALEPLLAAVAPVRARYDALAIHFGDRYRSGFWSIYLLSALATLCAVLPLALGWDSSQHSMHPYAGIWALGEVMLIGTVSLIYWRGHHGDWQGEWLRARTTAELCAYLPALAPLLEGIATPAGAGAIAGSSWYSRLFEVEPELDSCTDVSELCRELEPVARSRLTGVWSDPAFISGYSSWFIGILEEQRHYHRTLAVRQESLLHRVHRINATLFGLTGIAALAHLLVHSLWLSIVTTFFPALGASLHGALAQSESYRLTATSERLVHQLAEAAERIAEGARQVLSGGPGFAAAFQGEIRAVVGLLLEEHRDWHLMVRPHHLPLA